MSSERESCEVASCGFVWDVVEPSEIGPRIVRASAKIAESITIGRSAEVRVAPEVWSPLEYAGHVRDVLLNIRDRLVVGLNEENPLCKGLFGTPRIEMGLYAGDMADVVSGDLTMAASLFARTWDRIPLDMTERTMVYGYPRVADRSLRWVAAQALHEVEHHLMDVRSLLGDT